MARNRTDVVVLGAGAVGLACAYFLKRAGLSVQVLDRGKAGGGASFGNSGLITPSHAEPLCAPGAIGQALKWLFKDTAPLHVRPRLDLELARWFMRFASHCDAGESARIAAAKSTLLASSRKLTEKLVRVESLECEFADSGLMSVAVTEQGLDELRESAAANGRLGLEVNLIDGDQAREAEPALRRKVLGGVWFPGDAMLRPDRYTAELRWACHKRDIDIQEDCELKAINAEDGALKSVFTDRGLFEGKYFVAAAGAWTPQMLSGLKLKIPIQAGMGYALTSRRPDPCPGIPLILVESKIAVTPFADSFRLGGTLEFAGLDASPNPKRHLALIEGARNYLIEPLGRGEPQKWHGYRPMTPDDLPLIGATRRYPNLFLASGHAMLGMSMAAGTGRLVAELVTRRKTHVDPQPFDPNRFGGLNLGE